MSACGLDCHAELLILFLSRSVYACTILNPNWILWTNTSPCLLMTTETVKSYISFNTYSTSTVKMGSSSKNVTTTNRQEALVHKLSQRNLTAGIALDPSKADDLRLFRHIDQFKEYFYAAGVSTQLRQWGISREENSNGYSINKNNERHAMFCKTRREQQYLS